jgi:hypothetical protein
MGHTSTLETVLFSGCLAILLRNKLGSITLKSSQGAATKNHCAVWLLHFRQTTIRRNALRLLTPLQTNHPRFKTVLLI